MVLVTSDSSLWWEALNSFRDYTFFHTSLWYEIFESKGLIKKEKKIFIFRDQNQIKIAFPALEVNYMGLFKKIYSGPWGTYGGPLFLESHYLCSFFSEIFTPKTLSVTLTLHPIFSREMELEETPKYRIKTQLEKTYILQMNENFDFYFTHILERKRRNIYRRGLKCGLRLDRIGDQNLLVKFLRKNLKGKLKGREFLRKVSTLNHTEFLGAFLGNTLVSALVLVHNGEEVFAFLGCSDKRFNKLSPFTFLFVETIRYLYQRKGVKYFNMGASLEIKEIEHFKKTLGGVEYPVKIYQLINKDFRCISLLS